MACETGGRRFGPTGWGKPVGPLGRRIRRYRQGRVYPTWAMMSAAFARSSSAYTSVTAAELWPITTRAASIGRVVSRFLRIFDERQPREE